MARGLWPPALEQAFEMFPPLGFADSLHGRAGGGEAVKRAMGGPSPTPPGCQLGPSLENRPTHGARPPEIAIADEDGKNRPFLREWRLWWRPGVCPSPPLGPANKPGRGEKVRCLKPRARACPRAFRDRSRPPPPDVAAAPSLFVPYFIDPK